MTSESMEEAHFEGFDAASCSIEDVRRDSPDMPMALLVPEVIRRHSELGCRFADGAAAWAVGEASKLMSPDEPVTDTNVIPLAKIVVKKEVYCPHAVAGQLGCDPDPRPEPDPEPVTEAA